MLVPCLPGACCEGVRFRRECTNWAKVNHVARELGLKQFFNVRPDLHVRASPRGA